MENDTTILKDNGNIITFEVGIGGSNVYNITTTGEDEKVTMLTLLEAISIIELSTIGFFLENAGTDESTGTNENIATFLSLRKEISHEAIKSLLNSTDKLTNEEKDHIINNCL